MTPWRQKTLNSEVPDDTGVGCARKPRANNMHIRVQLCTQLYLCVMMCTNVCYLMCTDVYLFAPVSVEYNNTKSNGTLPPPCCQINDNTNGNQESLHGTMSGPLCLVKQSHLRNLLPGNDNANLIQSLFGE